MNLFQNGCKCKLCQQFSSRFSVQCLNIEFTISNGNLLLSVGFFPILLFLCFFGTRKFDVKKKTFIEFVAHFFLPISAYDCFEPFHNLVCNFKAKIFTSLWLRFHFGCTFFGYFSFDFVVESCFPQQRIRIDAFTKFVHRTHTHKNRLSANLALNYEIWHLNISIFSDRIQWEIQIDSVISLSTCKLHISKCFEVCWMNSEFLLCVCVDGEELKRTEFHWIGVLKFDVILWVTERKKNGGKIFGK